MYSVERMLELQEFSVRVGTGWCVLVLILTPLPCLLVIILTDAVPLNPPSDGLEKSTWFWWRTFLFACCISFTLLEQMRTFVPQLPNHSFKSIVWMTLVIGFGSTLYALWMATLVGFPLPFTLFFAAPSWQTLFWICLLIKWGRVVHRDRAVLQEMIAFYKVVIVQLSLTVVYPAYNYLFLRLEGYQQTAFALVLPLIKLTAKDAFSLVFAHSEDYRPEVVIFNVEIFHALFVSTAMQGSTSMLTTGVLMCVDILHAWMNLYDVDVMLRRLESQTKHVDQSMNTTDSSSIIQHALLFIALDDELHRGPSIRLQSLPRTPHNSGVLPSIESIPHGRAPRPSMSSAHVFPSVELPNQPHSEDALTQPEALVLASLRRMTRRLSRDQVSIMKSAMNAHDRRLFVTSALRMLHFTEFLVLIEFVEVAVPLIYTMYIVVTVNLPNHVYYPQLVGMDNAKLSTTIGNLLGHVLLELVSFVGLCLALQRKLQFSPVRQLVFVLHTQWRLVQSKMVLWVLFVVQISLQHFGYDYSFKFEWLNEATPS